MSENGRFHYRLKAKTKVDIENMLDEIKQQKVQLGLYYEKDIEEYCLNFINNKRLHSEDRVSEANILINIICSLPQFNMYDDDIIKNSAKNVYIKYEYIKENVICKFIEWSDYQYSIEIKIACEPWCSIMKSLQEITKKLKEEG